MIASIRQREINQRNSRPQPGEIPFKTWLLNEAERLGISYSGVFMRWQRGKYPHIKRRVVNRNAMFVTDTSGVLPASSSTATLPCRQQAAAGT